MDLAHFGRLIRPTETVLLLGAGASVPSGGMTGTGLAEALCSKVSGGTVEETDLAEACTLLCHEYSRSAVVSALRDLLNPLRPDGGMLGLLSHPWARIYTTNFDELAERAAKYHDLPHKVIRSNYDFGKIDNTELEIMKIHGCITQDRAFGANSSMVLTSEDYTTYSAYREALFGKMTFDIQTKDLLVIGQSLADPHLKRLVNEIVQRASQQSLGNKVRLLTYSADSLRTRVLEQQGLVVSSGPIDQLLENLTSAAPPTTPIATDPQALLPRRLLHRTVIVANEVNKPPSAIRLFNGEPATYADIAAGFTFARQAEFNLSDPLINDERHFLTILGASGVGKSTLARRVLLTLADSGMVTYEHKAEFPLDATGWLEVADRAAAAKKLVALLVDDASGELGPVNKLVGGLEDLKNEWFKVVLTSHLAQWQARSKSFALVKKGVERTLTILTPTEVESLVTLCNVQDEIRDLVKPEFKALSRHQQIAGIQSQCRSDMFVALKYCFPGEDLDKIVLQEFSQLAEGPAEVYKYVALVEAAFGKPSRQLILETLGLSWQNIEDILKSTRGIIVQRLVDRKDEVYSWSTRHPVIADVISRYKWFEQDELYTALDTLIDNMNAAQLLDRQLIPHLCDSKNAIGRIEDPMDRIQLFSKLTKLSTNRVPHHRIIATNLFTLGDLEATQRSIQHAESRVGIDSPIHRYKVLLKVQRGLQLRRELSTDDYLAILYDAWSMAWTGIDGWPENKYSYLTLADVAEAIYSTSGRSERLLEAQEALQNAYEQILDTELLRRKANLASQLK
ncbi:SIR2 family protein [Microlunatus aurantiacus]|uniref:SIR2 family NAD-dependent protein deacylase n=1 Tax=Microlunatus aurantiacus TaxID=446786 RepID=UPI0031CFDFF6